MIIECMILEPQDLIASELKIIGAAVKQAYQFDFEHFQCIVLLDPSDTEECHDDEDQLFIQPISSNRVLDQVDFWLPAMSFRGSNWVLGVCI